LDEDLSAHIRAAQPVRALAGEILHVVKIPSTHEHPAHGDHQHLVQRVIASLPYLRIGLFDIGWLGLLGSLSINAFYSQSTSYSISHV
jgi:hypothetical protein